MSYSRRAFLRGSTALATGLAIGRISAAPAEGATSAAGGSLTGSGLVPYTSDSFFRSRLSGAPIDSTRTASFRSFMKAQPQAAYPVVNGLDGNKWGMVYAEGAGTDQVWKLTGNVPSGVSVLSTQGFHAPDWLGAQLTGTSDSPFVVMDRGSGWSVWASKASVVGPGTISVGNAGLFHHDSNGLDRRNPRSNNATNLRSRGAIPDAMVIRRDLMDSGIAAGTGLGHVLHLFLIETRSADGYCHPMVGCEGSKYGWGAEGERIAIRPDLDLTTRGLSKEGLVLARTLQTHGAYIGDNAGRGTALKAEQATSTRNPWSGLAINRDSLKGITWDDFVVITKGWQA